MVGKENGTKEGENLPVFLKRLSACKITVSNGGENGTDEESGTESIRFHFD